MSQLVEKLDGVNMGQGTNLLPTPVELLDRAHAAMRGGKNTYGPQEGLLQLRVAIANDLLERHFVRRDPESELRVTSGATGALFSTLLALAGPGDEVVMLEPYYSYHLASVLATGATPRFVRLSPPAWILDLEAVEKCLTPRTRALIICNPSNPTARVLAEAELAGLVDICERHGIYVISDEVYGDLTFDGNKYIPVLAAPGAEERGILIGSFSKSYAVTGWRVGYVFAPKVILGKITLIHDALYICAPHPFQWALATMLHERARGPEDLRDGFVRRRNTVVEMLSSAGFACLPCEGTFYVMASYEERFGRISSVEACQRLLNENRIATVPAETFYHDGHDPGLLRFAFALPDELLDKAAELLKSK